jgi:hypothetical protein
MIGKAVPDTFIEIEEAVGVELMLAFLQERAGWQFKIPVGDAARTKHPEVIAWLQTNVGHGQIEIPLGPLRHETRMSWAIYLGICDGLSLSNIARKCGCTVRSVSATKARLKKAGLSFTPKTSHPKQDTSL